MSSPPSSRSLSWPPPSSAPALMIVFVAVFIVSATRAGSVGTAGTAAHTHTHAQVPLRSEQRRGARVQTSRRPACGYGGGVHGRAGGRRGGSAGGGNSPAGVSRHRGRQDGVPALQGRRPQGERGCGTALDHGVGIDCRVRHRGGRHGVLEGQGTSWRLGGYVLLERGRDTCGVLQSTLYPVGTTTAAAATTAPTTATTARGRVLLVLGDRVVPNPAQRT